MIEVHKSRLTVMKECSQFIDLFVLKHTMKVFELYGPGIYHSKHSVYSQTNIPSSFQKRVANTVIFPRLVNIGWDMTTAVVVGNLTNTSI